MTTDTLPRPPRQTANPAPIRPNHSVRRTSSIDVSWPDGPEGERLMIGRARDYATLTSGSAGTVLHEAEFQARLSQDKTITAITADPAPANLQALVGERGGGHLRMVIRERLPELLADASPLYLALDDISGTALVSAFAWSQWYPDWADKFRQSMGDSEYEKMLDQRRNICWGLQDGNSGVNGSISTNNIAEADGGDLRNPADPKGWHALSDHEGPGFRRARRIDVWKDAETGLICVDSAFQDTANMKSGGRVAIHEYSLAITANPQSLEILTLEPTAHILPFHECPGAIVNARKLAGSSLPAIRETVLADLRGPQGCTHLNDALRALADVPRLIEYLR